MLNLIDIILIILIGAALTGAVFTCIRNKKNGKSCGCGCSQCSGCGAKQKNPESSQKIHK